MRTARILGAVLLLCTISLPATAAEFGKATFSLDGGLAFPTAPDAFSSYWNTGFGVGGRVEVGMAPAASFVGSVEFNRLPFDEDGFLADLGVNSSLFSVDGASASILDVMVGFKVQAARGSARPYGSGSVGFGHLSTADATITGPGGETENVKGDNENKFAVGIGAGVDFVPSNGSVGFFVEARWVPIFTANEATQLVPVRVGVTFLPKP